MSEGNPQNLQRGGSVGHPKGVSLSEKFRALVPEDDQKAVVEAMVKAAKDGDVKAAEVVLERVFPRPRPLAEVVRVPGMREAKTLADKAGCVVAAVGEGHISPDAGQNVLRMLADAARVLEVSELAARIAALEAKARGEKVINPDWSDLA